MRLVFSTFSMFANVIGIVRDGLKRSSQEVVGRVRPVRMPQAPVSTYRVQYEPSRGSWTLTGPVGGEWFSL
jgi:hypothetical protein